MAKLTNLAQVGLLTMAASVMAIGPTQETNVTVGTTCAELQPLPQGVVCLDWEAPTENVDGSPVDDLAGYNLYYSPTSGVTKDNSMIMLPLGDTVEVRHSAVQIEAPANGGEVTMFFAMTAFDDDGNESDLSNEVQKDFPFPDTMPPKPPVLHSVVLPVETN